MEVVLGFASVAGWLSSDQGLAYGTWCLFIGTLHAVHPTAHRWVWSHVRDCVDCFRPSYRGRHRRSDD